MFDNVFLPETPAPEAASIAAALGPAHSWYESILEAAAGFKTSWRHYGRKYGWKLKIDDGEKALLELTVGTGSFRLGLAVREREIAALREDPAIAPLLETLLSGKAKEGWGLRIVVDGAESRDRALSLVRAVAALRRSE